MSTSTSITCGPNVVSVYINDNNNDDNNDNDNTSNDAHTNITVIETLYTQCKEQAMVLLPYFCSLHSNIGIALMSTGFDHD